MPTRPAQVSRQLLCVSGLLVGFAGCSSLPPGAPSDLHLRDQPALSKPVSASIPAPVAAAAHLPPPRPAAKTETYSVSVRNIPAQELLFALARDAKLNVDLHPGITGTVTINAIDQSLPQILNRLAKQIDMRWELDGPNLVVMPDSPYLRTYNVDYVNLARETQVRTEVSSQVASTGGKGGSTGTTRIESSTKNRFWETLEKNVKDILRETDKILPEGSSETVVESSSQGNASLQLAEPNPQQTSGKQAATQRQAPVPGVAASESNTSQTVKRTTFREAASVIANPETGVLAVRATARQHEKIQEFLDKVSASSQRQVMIEATIVEVELSDGYQQGINWGCLIPPGTTGYAPDNCRGNIQASKGSTSQADTPFNIQYRRLTDHLNLDLTLSLLQQFGNAKVLSSPKVSVLNNQTAVLNVSENIVFFEVSANAAAGSTGAATKAVNTVAKSVAVGLMMQVTPQIAENGTITLNVRPSITSLSKYVSDPNPELKSVSNPVENLVPQIKTREIESLLRLADGETAVLGGLMKEEAVYDTGSVPGVGRLPLFGELFTRRNNASRKSELVVFLRPLIVRSLADNSAYRDLLKRLPSGDFFAPPAGMTPLSGTPDAPAPNATALEAQRP